MLGTRTWAPVSLEYALLSYGLDGTISMYNVTNTLLFSVAEIRSTTQSNDMITEGLGSVTRGTIAV